VIRWRDEIRARKRDGPASSPLVARSIMTLPHGPVPSVSKPRKKPVRPSISTRVSVPTSSRSTSEAPHRLHLKVTGHKPGNLSLQEFLDTGVDGFQHAEYLPTTPREAFDNLIRERTRRNTTPWAMDVNEFNARFFSLEDPAEDARLYERMAREKLWVTPTLSIETHVLEHGTRDYESDERKRYIPPAIWRSWDPKLGRRSPDDLGTDSGADNDHVIRGWSAHEELEALVHAGLTPAEALRLATTNAATWRGDTNEGRSPKESRRPCPVALQPAD
jgi:hypothetical protein